MNNVFTRGASVGAVLGVARGCYTKGKERNCIKVICHPSSATVCKRNQKVDKREFFLLLRVRLEVLCQRGGVV